MCRAGQVNGLANHTRLLSPASEHVAIATGASSTAPAISQSAVRMRRGRYRTRCVPDEARRIAAASPPAPARPSTDATVSDSPISATNAPPSASNDATPHHPAIRSRGLAPARANPRASIDSASVTARSNPSSSTGTTWRRSRPRRTTRPPVRARSASRTSWMAASVDGTNASPTTTTSPTS